ncbi:uncharacterized protein N7484_008011 [Penicillium longicatenatum]|uniref:uncharacterized protein n=1 Tax=Penicillium longicatenatum TaxID=1561947 RepID=UPI002547DC78|nr:uncharacterized protein N7484_008011 [Penicillium longicatenatum]KAJ5640149.1 hypothetical protein N7484_008011 [Penicillium longicatenatum]
MDSEAMTKSWYYYPSRRIRGLQSGEDDIYSQNSEPNEPYSDGEYSPESKGQSLLRGYRKLHEQCEHLEKKLEESTKRGEDLERHLNSKTSRVQNLQEALDSCKKELNESKTGQVSAEERFRRQTELLMECSAALDTSLEENSSLIIQQATLQQWTDHLDDDEARQTTAQLYHHLETWVTRHFRDVLLADQVSPANPDILLAHESDDLDIFYRIYAFVSYEVFREFLTRTMIGVNDRDFNHKISILDTHIRKECPAHVAQNWRSAMSRVTSSISHRDLEADCKRLARELDSSYFRCSSSEPRRRIEDLRELLAKFVWLKSKLDAQADLYTFIFPEPGTPFNEEQMISFTGQRPANGIVRYSLSPALLKGSTGCDPILIKKATVVVSVDIKPSGGGY